ncbi:Ubiquitin domain-containing protein DSK2b [Porphyridium purpureum]|uniref:Ubiquitin domain-containing protein DSK2b n=1 Tax=Porphyridium purpureum TaxID=35688 RepID=A0A5J4YU25_PORPP|nr:Ubiquitin domain-containing protein DSK2b [Porphyridium purpureum]|eukprot:POR0510..scf227_4
MDIHIKSSTGSKFSVHLEDMEESIAAFKVRLAAQCDVEPERQRLIYRGHVLKDGQTIRELVEKNGLESGHTMHMVRSAAAPGTAPAPQPQQPAVTATPTPGQAAPAPGSNPFGGFGMGGDGFNGASAPGAGMMPPFGGAPGGLPGMDINQAQQMLQQNPDMMRQMMESPMMQSMMQNPELVRNIMMSNPQVRQLMETNPELAHILNDPNSIRQAMEMARNPAMMSEMTRNSDRAMANIEMMPGGFDALRRMHENVAAPLADAMQTPSNDNRTGADSENPFADLFNPSTTPSTQPMPNPWGQSGGPTAPSTAAQANPPGQTPAFPGGLGAFSGSATAPGSTPGAAPVPDMQGMMQMMEDPMMQQMVQGMMQHMMRDPNMREQLLNRDPNLRALAESNPQVGEMLSNPEFLQMMTSPEMMRMSMQLQNAMRGGTMDPSAFAGMGSFPLGSSGGTTAMPGTGTTPSTTNTGSTSAPAPDLSQLMGMFGSAGAPTGFPQAPSSVPQPVMSQDQLEQLYATQLQQLRDMGFMDTSMCINALQRSGGNVNLAVERLLGQFGQM